MADATTKVSKFLSLVLRHAPETIGLTLDANGWADVDDLLARAAASGRALDRATLERVVAESDKQRFALSDDGARIRANQGHSVDVDLALPPSTPPAVLYHGTSVAAVASIRAGGLLPSGRKHVHLSPNEATALVVGRRHGPPAVLTVAAADMAAAGHVFYCSVNGVWLTDRVPAAFIRFPDDA